MEQAAAALRTRWLLRSARKGQVLKFKSSGSQETNGQCSFLPFLGLMDLIQDHKCPCKIPADIVGIQYVQWDRRGCKRNYGRVRRKCRVGFLIFRSTSFPEMSQANTAALPPVPQMWISL